MESLKERLSRLSKNLPPVHLKYPERNPLWRARGLWLLEFHPKYALRLLEENRLQRELDNATNQATAVILNLRGKGTTDEELMEKLMREDVCPPADLPKEAESISKEDENRVLEFLNNLS